MKKARLTTRYFGSTRKWGQLCPYCGYVNPDTETLSQHTQKCEHCGETYIVDDPRYEYQDA